MASTGSSVDLAKKMERAKVKCVPCAWVCTVMSLVAIPFLLIIGFDCTDRSEIPEIKMIMIPEDRYEDASIGCFGAAFLYMISLAFALYVIVTAPKEEVSHEVVLESSALAKSRRRALESSTASYRTGSFRTGSFRTGSFMM